MDVTQFIALASNVVVAIVVPILAFLAKRLLDQQLEVLRSQVSLLKETQYDKAASLLRAQREVFEEERRYLSAQLSDLGSRETARQEEVSQVRNQLASVERLLGAIPTSSHDLTTDAVVRFIQQFGLRARGVLIATAVDCREVTFSGPVDFTNARFNGGLILDGAVLNSASFNRTDLRRADLRQALGDSHTGSPHVKSHVKGLR